MVGVCGVSVPCSTVSLIAFNILFLVCVNSGLLILYKSSVLASGRAVSRYLDFSMMDTPFMDSPDFIMYKQAGTKALKPKNDDISGENSERSYDLYEGKCGNSGHLQQAAAEAAAEQGNKAIAMMMKKKT